MRFPQCHRNDDGVDVVFLEIGVVDYRRLETLGRKAEMAMSFVRPLIVIGVFLYSSRWSSVELDGGRCGSANLLCDGLIEQTCEAA